MDVHLAIVILNWNQADLTLRCLASLEAAGAVACTEVLVVDNGSTDDSVAQIRAAYPDVTVIETGANLGYAGGNNVGIRRALEGGAEAVLILNNDTWVEPGCIEALQAALKADPAAGIATPLITEMDAPERIWALGMALDGRTASFTRLHAGEPVGRWRGQPPLPVDAASGSAMLATREVFERVGLLEERFFLYYEETDWCLRVRRAGYRILGVPSAVVQHQVSATLGSTSPAIDYYMLRNHLYLIGRHWRQPQRTLLQLGVLLRDLCTITAYTVKPHGGRRIPHRNARLMALRDAALGRWGPMGPDVTRVCSRGLL
jgi:GT2 family glycosyltransferase